MMKKFTVSFVQPNFQQGPSEYNAFYLPYSVGCIWAYANSHKITQDNFELNQLIFRRDDIETAAQLCRDDNIVGFSTYLWNSNYNHALAKRIKEINPYCVIVFGGNEFPITQPDVFDRYPYVDIYVKTEGEHVFQQILDHYVNKKSLMDIKGCLINNSGTVLDTGPAQRIDGLDEIPSPYLTGVFDKIIANNPNVVWNATLETNRGCPYSCTFCDWGGLTYNKVKKFGLERVFAELEWMGKYSVFVTFADANVGMFIERDSMIIDKFIEVVKKYNRIHGYNNTWAKNQKADVLSLVKKLATELPGQGQGLTVSVQSMDNQVLANIKRRNLDQHKIKEIFRMCEEQNIPVYTELILGLPGETLTSWKHGVYEVFRAGNHSGINFNHAHMITNTEMNLLQKKLFRMETAPVHDLFSINDPIKEVLMTIKSTSTMPYSDMLDAMTWNAFIFTFHIGGITSYIARFLAKSGKMDYDKFYDGFYQYLSLDPWMHEQFKFIRKTFEYWFDRGEIDVPKIRNLYMHGNFFNMWLLITIQHQRKLEHVFDLAKQYLNQMLDSDAELITQLIDFSKHYSMSHTTMQSMPITQKFDFDFIGYIRHNKELGNAVTLCFDTTENKSMTEDRFLQLIMGARKRNFGKSKITYLQAE
jgi:radical SAM superfamily enzyme YgiQ (UPF0313 family)